jgi:hypothetical protein
MQDASGAGVSSRRRQVKTRGVLFAGIVVLALAALAGCDLLGSGGTVVTGNLFIYYGGMPGGSAYHVVFYAEGTVMTPVYDPYLPKPGYSEAPQAASVSGAMPGTTDVLVGTVNFQLTDVPAGLYTVFGWVDSDGDGAFDPYQDLWGFYYGNPNGNTLAQPPANVVVPESGIVDLDLWVGANAG